MCVGFYALNHPEYALVLCSNRDEYLKRPTKDAHWHDLEGASTQPVLSGLDLTAGGTWFGLNAKGKIALLTNITEPYTKDRRISRGSLVSSFLSSTVDSTQSGDHVVDGSFAGFNMLMLFPTCRHGMLEFGGTLMSNGGSGGPITSRPLSSDEKNCGGVSNGIDGQDEWPKVQRGKQALVDAAFSDAVREGEYALAEHLFGILAWRSEQPPKERSQLRNTIRVEPLLSTEVNPPSWYGTRLSTVLLVKRDGTALFIERDIWQLNSLGEPVDSDPTSQRVFRFQVDKQQ